MKTSKITELAEIIRVGGIEGDVVKIGSSMSSKAKFKDLACAYLKHLAKLLELKDFEVHFNAGGPAVCGAAILNSDQVFVQIDAEAWGVLYRKCIRAPEAPRSKAARKNAKAVYSSAQFGNQWMPFATLEDVPAVVARLQAVRS